MALFLQPWRFLFSFLLFFVFVFPLCYCQFTPQNIETFYPFPIIPPPPSTPPPPPPPSTDQLPPSKKSTSTRTIVTAVAVTAAGVAVISGLFFFFFVQRYLVKRREKKESRPGSGTISEPGVSQSEFTRLDGNLRGFIVDENGLDVIYWRKLEKRKSKNSFNRSNENGGDGDNARGNRSRKSEPVQEIPLLRGKSSTSHSKISPEEDKPNRNASPLPISDNSVKAVGKSEPSQPPPRPPVPPSQSLLAVSNNKSSVPPPPPPIPAKTNSTPPPPPPIPVKTNPTPPPPPPKAGGAKSSLKPAPVPRGGKSSGESSSTTPDNVPVKLKPLHWDKVNTTNTDHSMVWDKMDAGSFKFDGDLMEALFGYVATNRKSPRSENKTANAGGRTSAPMQLFILEPKKSQNIAIIIKSLSVPRSEIVDALMEGQGLETEILEKLTRIALTQEEISQILGYRGDPQKLADAESFLYDVLRSVPSAFTRLNAIIFRSNYGSEIYQIKESLQTLESACKELRTRGLFLKLLEAILKAGNRLNAGTARGNARAFNLSALRKLSDVRSTDGKTTLLHFVVEEVVRAEGKKCVLNRNKSLSRSSSCSSNNTASSSENPTSKEDRVKEYMMLGLPVVGGLSAEFSNVKKAAIVEYDSLSSSCSSLAARTSEIRQLLTQFGDDGGRFAKEMREFLDAAEDELKVVTQEHEKVMEIVKKTTDYYQAGNSKDKQANRLQLFIIVKDFLEMVDLVCVEIARNLQKKRTSTVNLGSSPMRRKAIFHTLPENFMSDKSRGNSSDSDDDF